MGRTGGGVEDSADGGGDVTDGGDCERCFGGGDVKTGFEMTGCHDECLHGGQGMTAHVITCVHAKGTHLLRCVHH